MALACCQLISTEPWGTSRGCQGVGVSERTSTRLAEVLARSFMRGLTGSAMVRPSTVKE